MLEEFVCACVYVCVCVHVCVCICVVMCLEYLCVYVSVESVFNISACYGLGLS